jgi:hypothetical protein
MGSMISSLCIFALVWIGLWRIPQAISNSGDGLCSGIFNLKVLGYLLLTGMISTFMILSVQEFNTIAAFKILILTLLPLWAATMMNRYYYSGS